MRTLARSIWSKLARSVRSDDAPRPEARTLSDLAGTANAIVRSQKVRTRRGTFLVLVVGTLALLSVIAIVYVTIGTQDTRVQAAAAKKERVEDVPQRVGDYIADIIAQDRLATFYDDATIRDSPQPGAIPILMREISDYPSTDLQVRSDTNDPSGVADLRHASWRFDPAGRIDTQFWFLTSEVRAAVPPSDPWLAASEPTWIGVDPNSPDQLANPTDVTRLYRDMKDWGHISNFAPNGRFVNLFNLRDNFNAAPGTNPGQMSSGLTLYDANGEATNQTFFGEPADPNVPALWDTNQRGAARPAAFVPYGPAAALNVENPGSIAFKLYQWADTDGDGVLDARWFELIDDRNGFTNYLGDTGRYRYFVAARAVDLSGRVNVNTATDFRTAARIDAPAGITPADVDLLRLLALTDSYDFNAPTTTPNLLGGYDNFRSPTNPVLASNYAPIGGGDQLQYPPPNTNAGYARNRALQVADFGYASLRLSMASGMPLGPTTLDGSVSLQGPDLLATVPTDLNVPASTWDTSEASLGAERRRRMYERFATEGVGIYANANGWRSTVRFATPDLAELLTFNTANDPDTFSSLELVLGGRDDTANAPGPGSARYSPLRDNRDLKLELSSIPDAAYDPSLDVFTTRYLAQMQTDIRQRLTTLSGAVPLRPVRGVHPAFMTAEELPADIGSILAPGYDLATLASSGLSPLTRPEARIEASEAKSIFRAYADQLLPFSGVTLNNVNAWELGSRQVGELQTMAYGYRGPEVALYAAAHMTANFVDIADRERMTKNNDDPTNPATFDDNYELNIPSVFTLIVRPDSGDPFGFNRTPEPTDANGDDRYIGDIFTQTNPLDSRELHLNALTMSDRLPQLNDNNAVTVTPQDQAGVNIFGIEAQPFLTRVSVFTTYISDDSDTSDAAIDLDVAMSEANGDFAYRVVAWQLTNPFNVPVVLWDNATEGTGANQADEPKSRFYIEMDGRTYLIRPLNDNGGITAEAAQANTNPPASDRNIVIYPHRTIVLYTLSQTPTQIASRLPNTPGAGAVRDAIERAMGQVTDNDPGDTAYPTGTPQTYSPDLSKVQAMYYIGAINGPNPREVVPAQPSPVTFSTLINTDRPESRLWRRVRMVAPLSLGGGGGGLPIEFDQLVDRLRVPDGDPGVAVDPDTYPVLNRRLGNPASDGGSAVLNIDIPGRESEFDRPVLTLWASVRRPANPGQPALGALPAYCLEPKGSTRWNVFNNDRLNIASGSWDPVSGVMPRTTSSLDENMFESGDWNPGDTQQNSGFADFTDWWDSVRETDFTFVSATQAPANEDNSPVMLNVVPNLWGTTGVNPNLRTLVGNTDRPSLGNSASNANRYNINLPQTRFYNQWYPQVITNNANFAAPNVPNGTDPATFTRSVRVADMLLPLAVGPMMNPAFASNDSPDSGEVQDLSGRDWTNMELRWTTLGEAMAVAMGYQPTIGNTFLDSLSPSDITTLANPFAIDAAGAPRINYITRPLFDRGQLRLDEFVLFRDLNDNGVFDYASGNGPDIRLFTEAPAALGILDSFTVAPIGASNSEGGLAGLSPFAEERDEASLTRAIPGLININTAPPTVLRTLPGLAPWEDSQQLNEIQRITIGTAATPAVGDFSLQVGNAPLATIEVSAASAGALQAYIEGLDGVGPGNVKVTMITMNPPTFDVEFIGALAGTGFSAAGFGPMAVPNAPTSGSVTVSQLQNGTDPLIGPVWANGSLLDREVDLAAVIAATRDKSRQFLRPQSSVSDVGVTNAGLVPAAVRDNLDPGATANFAVEQLTFFDREPAGTGPVASRDLFWPNGFASDQVQTWLDEREGRRAATEIPGISEREGFATIGSMQAAASVRDGDPVTNRLTGLNTTNPANYVLSDFGALPISIDFMGYRTGAVANNAPNQSLYGPNAGAPRATLSTSYPGLSSGLFPTQWVTSGDRANRDRFTTSAVPGSYAEKLTPLAAISNIATTRSDYFAVWFVIHGFTEEDVLDIAATEPMVPSVARRFVMILDRSNVVTQDQRPKVVLFREVPYTP